MQMGKIKIVLVVLCFVALAFEIWHLRSGHSVQQQATVTMPKRGPQFALLPESEIPTYTGVFAAKQIDTENWEPTLGDINDLEANLTQIAALSSKDPDPNKHIDHPGDYFRQYLAVAVNGRKTIFVNALCKVESSESWRKRLVVVVDGGKCYWHAVYDSASQTFSGLIVNGRG